MTKRRFRKGDTPIVVKSWVIRRHSCACPVLALTGASRAILSRQERAGGMPGEPGAGGDWRDGRRSRRVCLSCHGTMIAFKQFCHNGGDAQLFL
jgi:hypothetical protein